MGFRIVQIEFISGIRQLLFVIYEINVSIRLRMLTEKIYKLFKFTFKININIYYAHFWSKTQVFRILLINIIPFLNQLKVEPVNIKKIVIYFKQNYIKNTSNRLIKYILIHTIIIKKSEIFHYICKKYTIINRTVKIFILL